MRSPVVPPVERHPRALRLALFYAAAAALWLLLGDAVAAALDSGGAARWLVQTLDGFAFVLLTGVLLYLLLVRQERLLVAESAAVDLVLRQLPGLVWATDRELRITWIAGDLDQLGFDPQRLLGGPVAPQVVGPERRAVIESAHLRALGGEVADYRIELGERELLARVEPLRDDAGGLVGCVGFALEQPPESDGQESVRESFQRSRWLGALGSLTLAVAHQIKNPLFAITAALDSFEARTGDQPETARHRLILRQQAERIDRLVSALQVYGRSLELDLRQTDLAAVVEASLVSMRQEAAAAGVELTSRVDVWTHPLRVDREALAGAIGRVIRNAVEHSPRGGRVTVTGQADRGGAREMVEISVLDRGPGFAEADLDRVFEPLFTRRPGGSGLGLAIAERIVRAHGGRMVAANRDVGGARVTLRLPA